MSSPDDEWSPPKYAQVVKAIRERIADGTYRPGDRIPSEAELIAEFGYSRPTVVRALQVLELRGLIDRVHGRGSYVKSASEHAPEGAEEWKPGDIVLDAVGKLLQRSAHPRWVWDTGVREARTQWGVSVPDGATEESEAVPPLILLVRDGYAVGHPRPEA
ncbi:GntR family transcriptional regulator [Streptosporangium sp. OZ121]|uniref:GntR family transcriptional regulator n=1 Tax=Streptosporangium sp. OZ121 TaxID=3444183 RepID=UPI003F7A017A